MSVRSVKKFLFSGIFLGLFSGMGYGANFINSVHEYDLDNGLKLLVRVDHRAPVVMSQVWYQVGSRDESIGQTGVSHFLEHMMYQGTETFPPGELMRLMASSGGISNAYTYQDGTMYADFMPKNQLGLIFQLESDRMENLSFGSDQFIKEKQVILEERRGQIEDSPMGYVLETLNYVGQMGSPYANPVIGWKSDIDQLSIQDLDTWYSRYYVPNLATVIVVGDVNPDTVYQLALQYFGGIKSGDLRVEKNYPFIPQSGVKHLLIKRPDVQVPALVMSFRVPSIASSQAASSDDQEQGYGLIILANLLAGMESSRMQQDLVRDQNIASQITIQYSSLARFNTLLTITAEPMPGVSLGQLEAAIFTEIQNLSQTPPSPSEINRAVTYAESQHLYNLDSPFGQASLLGQLSSGAGLNWQLSSNYLLHLKTVGSDELVKLINQYLTPDNLVDAELVPAPADLSLNTNINSNTSAPEASSGPSIDILNNEKVPKFFLSNPSSAVEPQKFSQLDHDPALLNNFAIRDRAEIASQTEVQDHRVESKLGNFL